MRRKTKILLKTWIKRFFYITVIILLCAINIHRLNNNFYPNHEQITDFGSIKEGEKPITPIIAAIFYKGKNNNELQISTYFNHSENYKRKNIKMMVIPEDITSDSSDVIKKLYEEIIKNNTYDKALLVYENNENIDKHKNLINKKMKIYDIKECFLTQNNIQNEPLIDKYLTQDKSIVIFLANLDKINYNIKEKFLAEEVIYFAQKYFYQINVFDIIDTQLAQQLDKDYGTIYPFETIANETNLEKQKRNLAHYKNLYWRDITSYFELNLANFKNNLSPLYPEKNDDNHRLYDRGRVLIKAYDEDYFEIFERTEDNKKQAVIISVINIAKKLKNIHNAKYFKIYLLTNLEPISDNVIGELDYDDGIAIKYQGRYTYMISKDRPDNPYDIVDLIKKKANINTNIENNFIEFYKFKTEELPYDN